MREEELAACASTDWDVSRRQFVGRGASVGAVIALGPVLGACAGDDDAATQTKPKAGGRLRVGYIDDDPNDIINPLLGNTNMALARVVQVFEGLTGFDNEGNVVNLLAEEITPNAKVDEWTVRLPAGVEFHNGKTLTADDVIYTYQLHLDPKNNSTSLALISDIDPAGFKKLDARTLVFKLRRPNAFFKEIISRWSLGIFPEGTKSFEKPIGTGPFELELLAAGGKRTNFTKHPNYRINGRPYLDRLEIISINDAQARVNALLSGQVDVVCDVPPVQLKTIEDGNGVELENVEGGRWNAQTLGCKTPEFKDPRVRQAMRLLVDREQIKNNVFAGNARIANDIYGWFDPGYPDVEDRTYDPEQAKSLLKAAGAENLTVEWNTGALVGGLLDAGTLMAQQAKAAGVNLKVQNRPVDAFWTKYYMQSPSFSTYWPAYPIVLQSALSYAKGSTLNEGSWEDPEWQKVYGQALASTDPDNANELLQESQRIAYDRGPYIIPVFPNYLDARRSSVQGIQRSPAFNLGFFNFRETNIKS